MMKNYLEMVQSVERDREALIFSDHVYTYGNLVDLALEQQRRFRLEGGKQQLAVIRKTSILEQLVSFLACQGTGAVPLIVPAWIPQCRMLFLRQKFRTMPAWRS